MRSLAISFSAFTTLASCATRCSSACPCQEDSMCDTATADANKTIPIMNTVTNCS